MVRKTERISLLRIAPCVSSDSLKTRTPPSWSRIDLKGRLNPIAEEEGTPSPNASSSSSMPPLLSPRPMVTPRSVLMVSASSGNMVLMTPKTPRRAVSMKLQKKSRGEGWGFRMSRVKKVIILPFARIGETYVKVMNAIAGKAAIGAGVGVGANDYSMNFGYAGSYSSMGYA